MFEELSEKLDGVLGGLRQRGVLTEPMIREGLREIRRVLLEADVDYALTKQFLARVEEQATGEKVLRSVRPGEQVVKIVHDELVHLLGDEAQPLRPTTSPPLVVMLVGLQGSGKTTTAAKLARRLDRENRSPLLAALDVRRPAAIDQLEMLGAQVGVSVHAERDEADVVAIARRARERAREQKRQSLILDTAGRLQIDAELMDELRRLKEALEPDEVLLVTDAMIGQEAVRVAQGFHEALGLTGVVLTKLDGDARGGAALSIRGTVGVPVRFVGVGERPDALELFDPRRMAGRILQQGDVVGLVERAQELDQHETERLANRVAKGGKFDLEDFLAAMRQMQKLGPLEGLLKMIPGMNTKLLKGANLDPKRIRHVEAIILSMTPEERRKPAILNGSRRARIAKGSGRTVQEVNRLMKQYQEMQKMMKQMRGMGLGALMGGGPGGPGSGMSFPGLPRMR
ncbi:MAG TPA: signal recognition particle protein [Longimicrobiales bacterium]|nr:signal recognition particle protein [Longimicrobiales bacterium]